MEKFLTAALVAILAVAMVACHEDAPEYDIADADTIQAYDCYPHRMQSTGSRRALLIGISKYEDTSWNAINAHNDIALLSNSLDQHGFSITTLEDSTATCNGIKDEISKLTSSSSAGDTVLLHFSCHGQQVCSEYSIKQEMDMLDESMVPYDAYLKKCPSDYGQNHLTDDTLNQYLSALSEKLGREGLLLIFADACHSGDIDRNAGTDASDRIVRGVYEIFGSDELSEKEISQLRNRTGTDAETLRDSFKSSIAYVSACGSSDLNKEIVVDGKGYGSLSYSLSEALERSDFDNTNSVLNRVIDAMRNGKPAQNPVIKSNFYQAAAEARPEPTSESRSWYMYLIALCCAAPILILFVWKKKRQK